MLPIERQLRIGRYKAETEGVNHIDLLLSDNDTTLLLFTVDKREVFCVFFIHTKPEHRFGGPTPYSLSYPFSILTPYR